MGSGERLAFLLYFLAFLVFPVLAISSTDPPVRHYAVLVATSNGYVNYRHQADVCHSYHVLLKNGFDPNNIIVFLYDDIAYSPQNIFQGKLFNEINGPDVYQNVVKDYTYTNVNPSVLESVLLGQDPGPGVGSRRYLESGPNDNVFLYMAGHGLYGRMCFPDPNSVAITTSQVSSILQRMKQLRKFRKMAIYVEACNSASLFNQTVLESLNVYAMTAANANQPSVACNLDRQLKAYLGDYFSVRWMDDSEKHNPTYETVADQYNTVQKEVFLSEVCQIGNLAISNCTLLTFQGTANLTTFNAMNRSTAISQKQEKMSFSSVDKIEESLLHTEMEQSATFAEKAIISKKIMQLKSRQAAHQAFYDTVISKLSPAQASPVNQLNNLNRDKCKHEVVDAFEDACFPPCLSTETSSLLNKLILTCDHNNPENVVQAIKRRCAEAKNSLQI